MNGRMAGVNAGVVQMIILVVSLGQQKRIEYNPIGCFEKRILSEANRLDLPDSTSPRNSSFPPDNSTKTTDLPASCFLPCTESILSAPFPCPVTSIDFDFNSTVIHSAGLIGRTRNGYTYAASSWLICKISAICLFLTRIPSQKLHDRTVAFCRFNQILYASHQQHFSTVRIRHRSHLKGHDA